ncbi:TonB-dependent siderophore receptor [Rhizobium rhizophilum]|uniref:TonB-dependent siderophore receptor n=1 Tax=Rhizobium rhizophilum TaxID=1850373 RepID=UPI001F286195|nr:TonB-dependent siderophore receptor [Rhizobium rhizophilum]
MSTAIGAGLATTVDQAVAQSSAQSSFSVPAGPLHRALTAFGRQAGLQVTYLSSAATGKTSPGFSGSATREQALAEILAGSGLTYSFPNATTVAISAPTAAAGNLASDGSTQLNTIEVQGENAWGPVDGIVATQSATGTKTGTPLKNTPQAVNVVTRDQMEAQGAATVTQVLRYTPGVVAQYSDTDVRHDWLTVRGFMPGRYRDGLRLPFGARGYSQPKIEPYGLERAEVLKGPASVLYGQGLPGGMLNMVSKRPQDEEIREVELQYGSHDRFQAAFDVGGKLDEDGAFLYRLVGVGRLSDTQYDYVEERKGYIAPSFTFKPDEGTSLTLLGEYQNIDSPGGGGAPALTANGTLYTDGYAELPRNAFLGEPGYDRFKNEQAFIGYEFSHEFNDTWTFKQNLRYGYVDTDTQRVQAFCLAACDPSAQLRYAWAFPESSRLFTVDNQAIARFSTGDVSHTAIFGLDYSFENSRFEESTTSPIWTPLNVYDPVYGATTITRPGTNLRIDQDRSQAGLYAQDQIEWGNAVFSLGGRYDWADTETLDRQSGKATRVDQTDGKFTWRTGLVYNFDSGFSPYASYSTSFNPASGTDRAGLPFDPTTGEQFEVGVRYQPAGMNSFISLSAYDLTQQNVLAPDPLDTSKRVQTGEVRMRGLELEGKAEINDAFSVIASYAYTDSEITRDNKNANGVSTEGNRLAFVPEHQAALWLDYSVQSDGAWGGLSFGGGARYVGQTFGDNANAFDVPGYTLFDAALRYDFGKADPKLEGLKASLNVSNLFDKKYVSTCIGATGCYWGEGRTVYGTLKYSW